MKALGVATCDWPSGTALSGPRQCKNAAKYELERKTRLGVFLIAHVCGIHKRRAESMGMSLGSQESKSG